MTAPADTTGPDLDALAELLLDVEERLAREAAAEAAADPKPA